MDYISYALPNERLDGIEKPEKVILCEIWNKLPPVEFVRTQASGGKEALRAEGKDHYVWVPPDTTEVLGPRLFFSAIGYRSDVAMDFFLVTHKPRGISLKDFIAQVKDFNENQLVRIKKMQNKLKIEK
jgi:hypothetical protein